MKTTSTALAALAVSIAPIVNADPKVVSFQNLQYKPIQRTSKHSASFDSPFEQKATVQAQLVNQQFLYAINLTIGTPAQSLGVQIDTGSSDLWVPVANSNLCATRTAQCNLFGTFNPSSSSSIRSSSTRFQIQYGDGTTIGGTFVRDTVRANSATVTQVQFAAATSGTSDTNINGILGIGYEANEAGRVTYTNFVSSMQQQGLINTRAYSLWLNDLDSADGNVLFGGVDTAKFNSPLISIPVVPSSGGAYTELSLPLTAVSFSADGKNFTYTKSGFASPALIDSGTTLMYLPDDVVSNIFRSFGAQVDSQTGAAVMDCNAGTDPTAQLTFTFNGDSGAKINVALNDLLFGGVTRDPSQCQLLISGGAPDGLIILGDSFMRSAYIVYDLDNNQIAIANTKFNATDSNVQEISGSSIPSASVMSTLASGLNVNGAATSVLPQGTGISRGSASSTSVAVGTSAVPTFQFTQTTGASSASATRKSIASPGKKAPVTGSIIGVVTGTITLLSVFGGAMMMWF